VASPAQAASYAAGVEKLKRLGVAEDVAACFAPHAIAKAMNAAAEAGRPIKAKDAIEAFHSAAGVADRAEAKPRGL